MQGKMWAGIKGPEPVRLGHQCVRCGGIRFNTWLDYADHMAHSHDVKATSDIKPANKTGRSKAQIVQEWESAQRLKAWGEPPKPARPNPFIGRTDSEIEPVWNEQREVMA